MRLPQQILISIVCAPLFALLIPDLADYVWPLGDIFIRMLKMVIIPLVMASMVSGVANLQATEHISSIGIKSFLLFILTTIIAVTIGLSLGNFFHPGTLLNVTLAPIPAALSQNPPSVTSIILGIVPTNIFQAMAEGNILSIIFFSILVGIMITIGGERFKPIKDIFDSFNDLMLTLTKWIMRFSPIGIFALVVTFIAEMGFDTVRALGFYSATVMLGLAIHAFVVLPLMVKFLTGISPFQFWRVMFPAIGTAFSTASSAAALPSVMDRLIRKANVSHRITSFTIPLGTTMNMDGTALYQSIAVMFIAQFYGIDLSFGQQLIVLFMTMLASVGAAGIPSAGLVTMAIVLEAVGVDVAGIGIIIGVDRMLDMCRTGVNVWGNACVALIVAKSEGERLALE